MHRSIGFLGAAALLLVQASSASAVPVDLTDTTDRMIEIEIVTNADVGVYASDPEAMFTSLGEVTISFSDDIATITIPAAVWELSLEDVFGASANGTTDPGIVMGTTTDYVMTIDITTGAPGPSLTWMADLIVDLPPILTIMLDYRKTNTANAETEFSAPAGTDYFFEDTSGLPISCDEWSFSMSTEAPEMGECDAADFRGDAPYDPSMGTYTYLGVASNQFVPSLASPNYSLTRFRIMEVPEPGAIALQLAAFATLSLVARRRHSRSA